MRFSVCLFLSLLIALSTLASSKAVCIVRAENGFEQTTTKSKPDSADATKPAQVLNELISTERLLFFAQTFIGTPYHFGSDNPLHGFDCSGFVSYVFKNFNFEVPRSAMEFMSVGKKVQLTDAQPGDIILFKGTKTYHPHKAGHMGIILSNDNNELKFIHSSSGKEHGVTITTLDDYYRSRFLQIVRVFTK